jgi:hypothetical protein
MQQRTALGVVAAVIAALALVASSVSAETGAPVFDLKVRWGPTHLTPGGQGQFTLEARNIGDAAAAEEQLAIVDHLPDGVIVTSIAWTNRMKDLSRFCSGVGTETVTCMIPASESSIVPSIAPRPGSGSGVAGVLPTGYLPPVFIDVAVDPEAAGTAINTASISGGGGPSATATSPVTIARTGSGFGLLGHSLEIDAYDRAYPSAATSRQAGSHPFEQRFNFDLTTEARFDPGTATLQTSARAPLSATRIRLPQGLVGDPLAVPRCDPVAFSERGAVSSSSHCPPDTQVGYVNLIARDLGSPYGIGFLAPLFTRIPIYNLRPPRGEAVDFGFVVAGLAQQHIYLSLDPERNYALTATAPNTASRFDVLGAEVTIWGVPGDPAHDRFRYFSETTDGQALGAPFGSAPIRPLLTVPADCDTNNGGARIEVSSYENPGAFTPALEYPDPFDVEGCDDPRLQARPTLSLSKLSRTPASPSGLDLRIEVPKRDDEVADASDLYPAGDAPEGVAAPPLRTVRVQLPAGLSISPAVAQGLDACSEKQIGLVSASPPRFDAAPPSCPEASRIGTIALDAPFKAAPLRGSIYLAAPRRNAYRDLISLYIAVEDAETGIFVKLPARLTLGEDDGRITIALADLPQQPFSALELHFEDGPRAVLRTPPKCGAYAFSYAFSSWANPDPVRGSGSFVIDRGCSAGAFVPRLSGGSVHPVAGSASPFVVQLVRADGEENPSELRMTLPPGLAGKLAAIPECGSSEIARAGCPAASKVGSFELSVGTGSAPLWLPQAGKTPGGVYLAGPYKGAPFSLALILPLQAGPFDLGIAAVRAAVFVNPHSGQLTIATDRLPDLVEGVPIDYRTLRLVLDRPGFVANPTSCEPMRLKVAARSREASTLRASQRFQLSGCPALGLRPQVRLRLSGATAANGHPTVSAEVEPRKGDANLSSFSVLWPRGELIDPLRFRDICGRDQFAAGTCPPASRRGWLRVWSPLLDRPLRGRVYLRQSDDSYPELAAPLHGEVDLILVGRIRTPHARVGARFSSLPDLPISRLRLVLSGGRRGLLVNSEDLCGRAFRGQVRVSGHNGRRRGLHPQIVMTCGSSRRFGKG